MGCCGQTTPAVAVIDGCVWSASLLGKPASSRKVPKFETLLVTPAKADVPVLVSLLNASGVPAVGLTRIFCQGSLQTFPEALALVIVNTNCVELTEVKASTVPLATELIFL